MKKNEVFHAPHPKERYVVVTNGCAAPSGDWAVARWAHTAATDTKIRFPAATVRVVLCTPDQVETADISDASLPVIEHSNYVSPKAWLLKHAQDVFTRIASAIKAGRNRDQVFEEVAQEEQQKASECGVCLSSHSLFVSLRRTYALKQ